MANHVQVVEEQITAEWGILSQISVNVNDNKFVSTVSCPHHFDLTTRNAVFKPGVMVR
jgi:hypothetical protein